MNKLWLSIRITKLTIILSKDANYLKALHVKIILRSKEKKTIAWGQSVKWLFYKSVEHIRYVAGINNFVPFAMILESLCLWAAKATRGEGEREESGAAGVSITDNGASIARASHKNTLLPQADVGWLSVWHESVWHAAKTVVDMGWCSFNLRF